jgi:hypothetical protein
MDFYTALATGIIAILLLYLIPVFFAWLAGRRPIWFAFLIDEDNRYSLSKVQMWLWTFVAVGSFVAVCVAKWTFVDVPPNIIILMGLSQGTFLGAKLITINQLGPDASGSRARFGITTAAHPSLLDLFSDQNGMSLSKFQMFAWTLVAIGLYITFLVSTLGGPKSAITMPDIPSGMLGLMGISQGAYLLNKGIKPSS